MSRNWEEGFSSWAKPPSKTEEERIQNTINQIREAIINSVKLSARNIDVFVQGSYRNNVNVRKESDIDIGVVCSNTIFLEYSNDEIKKQVWATYNEATYEYSTFKQELYEALANRFGREAVTKGNKAFDIKASSYRVEADVATFFEHRRYTAIDYYLTGVELRPDDKPYKRIINWPEQHYNNGVYKNKRTGMRYKKLARILKKLAIEMEESGVSSTQSISGFLIECLIWNVPDTNFDGLTYYGILRNCLAYLYNNTLFANDCAEWGEVSELKYIFKGSTEITHAKVNKFIGDAWDYVGYE